ncbi:MULTISPECIES: Nif3-like dinuclear metal center hexameric protein [unclassified Agarivorans]|uniref:Nif3-like dinuclear metal center hexameric protein n=1 Tax=unclassified Agarivorans TaxID=2636026 RepID=UPI0026E47365|nr:MULTISPECIES: Nif3-like dinuclear metal center hexameric protein [unclassified Agarivorans]MDO6686448.1 Nif3-like dinuclear metal center hexameric protein [Agarivorans sp. 3_MG-2023]MDO6713750.1 Nif3-like dinuclear metal center hexameric protein [Agarivorans sp. 2_MG-2023]MDO6762082.1 Nif3-like dinuclear metal center hexameric protein [Agarivorans sp. 1_MG-2023]
MKNTRLENILNQHLESVKFKDYCPNGLQVEGREQVKRVVTGVTACQALIDQAIEVNADAILVHHGFFWKNEAAVVTGMKRRRLQALLNHDINLYAYHLPLDVHPELGNNAQLAKRLGITLKRGLEPWDPRSVAMVGKLAEPVSGEAFAERIEQVLQRKPLHISNQKSIQKVGICTGGGQSYLTLAAEQGLDAFISGEISENTVHTAREMGIDYFAAGHHATERYGAQALGEWLAVEHGLDVSFIDIDNPV